MNWTGEHPYDSDQWVAGHERSEADWISNPKFLYPLPLAILFAPLGLLSLAPAYITWIYLSELFLAISILILIWRKTAGWKHLILPLASGAFLFRPTMVTLRNGQLGALLLLIITLTIFFWSHQKWLAGGILLAFVSLKPTVGFPIIGLAGLWLIQRRKLSAIAGILSAETILLAIAWIRDPNWLAKYLSICNQKLASQCGYSPTVWGVGQAICSQSFRCSWAIGATLFLLLFFGTVFLLINQNITDPLISLSLVIPAGLAITPYIWAYDQILLVIPIAMIVLALLSLNYPYLLAGVAPLMLTLLSLFLVFLAIQLGHDAWSFVLPLACFAGAACLRKKNRVWPDANYGV